MSNVYEYIDEFGTKKILDILSIFTIDGYEGKYALASSDDAEILGYQVVEEDNNMNFISIKNKEIEKIVKEMIEMLLR